MNKNSKRLEILERIEHGELSPEEGARLLKEFAQMEADPSSRKSRKTAMEVLESVERGELSAQEASEQLKGAGGAKSSHTINIIGPEDRNKIPAISKFESEQWRRWWQIPLWVGFGILLLGGFWMNAAYQSSGANLWFYCAWAPLLLGLLLMVIGAQSCSSRWLHIRVKHDEAGRKQNVAFSLPLPLGLSAWALRNFGYLIPNLDATGVDEIIEALDKQTGETPFYVEVEDDTDGEHVEIFVA
jgi:hypothetical protein